MKIYDEFEQGTDEWFAARAGWQTASRMGDVLSAGRGGNPSKVRQTYMYQLAGERLTGEPMWSYINAHMNRGTDREAEARALYQLETGNAVHQVAFILDDYFGGSPDGLVGNDGMVEIKDRLAHIQIGALDSDKVPSENMTQLQSLLAVSGREWIDYMSHCRGLPPFIKRVYRDERRIAEIKVGARQFEDELCALVERIRRM